MMQVHPMRTAPPSCRVISLPVNLVRQKQVCGCGLALGATLFLIGDEIIPESHRMGHDRLASYGLVAGPVVILALNLLL